MGRPVDGVWNVNLEVACTSIRCTNARILSDVDGMNLLELSSRLSFFLFN